MSFQSTEKVIEGNWDQLKGKIKNQWGKLTDKDISKIDGSYQELIGKIKECYGYTDKEIENQLDKLKDNFDFNDIKKVMGDSVDNIKEKSENVIHYVKEHPMKAVFIAIGIGILTAKILGNHKH